MNNYLLGEGTQMKVSEIGYVHPIVDFLNKELPLLNSTVFSVFIFNVKTGFFSRKQLFLAVCYKTDSDKQKSKTEIDKLLQTYFNDNSDAGINIVNLCLDVDSEVDFMKYIESQIKRVYSLL